VSTPTFTPRELVLIQLSLKDSIRKWDDLITTTAALGQPDPHLVKEMQSSRDQYAAALAKVLVIPFPIE
jgi:hypothetical protein